MVPRFMDRLMEAFFFSKQKSGRPANRADDALDAPTTGLRERGIPAGHVRESSLYHKAALRPVLTGVLLVGAGLALVGLLGAASSNGRGRPGRAARVHA